MKTKKINFWMILLVLIVGALLGTALWSLLDSVLPAVLSKTYQLGTTTPFVLNLHFFTVTLGLLLHVNIGGMLGMIAALLIYLRIK